MENLKRRLQIFLFLFAMVTIAGTLGFMMLENLSVTQALYYNIVTMSTVGYGDIHPTNDASRWFAVLIIVMGGASFLGVIANATEIIILRRETSNRMRKINMVLGAFFSEIGYTLLDMFAGNDGTISQFQCDLCIQPNWDNDKFTTASRGLAAQSFQIQVSPAELNRFSQFLSKRRGFLINLIENPVLVEHESLSETLLAIFHLSDELQAREDFARLPQADINHLTNDMTRAYKHLTLQWIEYLRHLKVHYPYLFSLAIRKNPFDPDANPVIQGT
ncbi:MAG: two pore domain potassium channel family protein [Desulfobacteraceae bacterium]|nr:MAG: two pore domain potassium channel family protein [Desulfobacteraceae bacterium]